MKKRGSRIFLAVYLAAWCAVMLGVLLLFTPDITGDEPWFSDAALTMVTTGEARNTIFPETSLNEGYGLLTQWLFLGVLGGVLKSFGVHITLARLPVLAAALLTLLLVFLCGAKISGEEHGGDGGAYAALLLSLSLPFVHAATLVRPDIFSILFLVGIFALCLGGRCGTAGAAAALGWGVHPNIVFIGAGGILCVMIFRGEARRVPRVLAVMAGSFLCVLGVSGLLGGFNLDTFGDINRGYRMPLLKLVESFSLENLGRIFVRKTYYHVWIGLTYPLVSLGLFLAAAGLLARMREYPRELFTFVLGAWLAFSIFVPKAETHYFLYYVPFAALGAGYTFSQAADKAKILLLVLCAGAGAYGLATAEHQRYPAETYRSLAAAVPDGTRVWGYDTYWFATPYTRYHQPLFLDDPEKAARFDEIVNRLGADYVIARLGKDEELRRYGTKRGERVYADTVAEVYRVKEK